MSASMTETTPSSRHCGSASWMLNTSASGSARPVVSTTILSGSIFSMISFTAASNSPSNEQQTQPPPSSAIRTFFPSITFVSIAISPNSFITIAIFAGRVARMCRSSVVLALPSGPVTRVMVARGHFLMAGSERARCAFAMHEQFSLFSIDIVLFQLRGVVRDVVDHPQPEILGAAPENFGKNFADAVKDHLPVRERHVEPAFHRGEIIAALWRFKRRARQFAVKDFDAVFALHHFQKNLEII